MMSKPYQAKIIEQLHIVINEQVASMAILECNKTVQTSMVWFAYEVDADSHNKYQMYYLHRLSCKKVSMELWKSCLKFRSFFTRSLWVTINQNPDQWNGSKLPVKFNQHTRTYLEIWTSQTGLQIWSWNRSHITQKARIICSSFRFPWASLVSDCSHLFQCHKKPPCSWIHQRLSCQGVLNLDTAVNYKFHQITIGWGQVLRLDGKKYTIDPDNPTAKRFNYTWWCRYTLGWISKEIVLTCALKTDRLEPSWGVEHVQNWRGRARHQRRRDHGEIPNICSKQSPTDSPASWSTIGWPTTWMLWQWTRAYEGQNAFKKC